MALVLLQLVLGVDAGMLPDVALPHVFDLYDLDDDIQLGAFIQSLSAMLKTAQAFHLLVQKLEIFGRWSATTAKD